MEHFEKSPKASKSIVENPYVDGFVMNFSNEGRAENVTKRSYKYSICLEFNSFIKKFGTPNSEYDDITKVLGLLHDTSTDQLVFKVRFHKFPPEVIEKNRKTTKRDS